MAGTGLARAGPLGREPAGLRPRPGGRGGERGGRASPPALLTDGPRAARAAPPPPPPPPPPRLARGRWGGKAPRAGRCLSPRPLPLPRGCQRAGEAGVRAPPPASPQGTWTPNVASHVLLREEKLPFLRERGGPPGPPRFLLPELQGIASSA